MKLILLKIIILGLFISEIQANNIGYEEQYCNHIVFGINYGDDYKDGTWAFEYGKQSVNNYVDGYSAALHTNNLLSKKLSNTGGNILVYMVCEEALALLRNNIKKGRSKKKQHEMFSFITISLATENILNQK